MCEQEKEKVPGWAIAGMNELAQDLYMSKVAIYKLRMRHADFPEPIAQLMMGDVYDIREVRDWNTKRVGKK